MTTRKVLTVNQVFDILVHWIDHRDWARAFAEVVPKRKLKNAKRGQGDGTDSDQEQAEVAADLQLSDEGGDES